VSLYMARNISSLSAGHDWPSRRAAVAWIAARIAEVTS